MAEKYFLFAGGGTGGHIYPGIAVAEKILQIQPDAKIHFFCSNRAIDTQIMSKTKFVFTKLPAEGFSIRPAGFVKFLKTFFESVKIIREKIDGLAIERKDNAVIVGIGGFAAAPVCYAGYKKGIPVNLINVDIIPGKANKLIARWANEIFVQFEETAVNLKRHKKKIKVVGCPLRSSFDNPRPDKAGEKLRLSRDKKVLLITGASSGSQNINNTICSLLGFLERFADKWQIVHLTGVNNFEEVKAKYADAKISHRIVSYYDEMADLLAAADLVIGRSGAVSVAEFLAAGTPSICMPYPFHKDMHQYLNASKLVEAGAAIIVDDLPNAQDRADWLAEELEILLKDDGKLKEMKQNCKTIARKDAARIIAEKLMEN
jgi:UDP-N-acetylglucosamine--N-acetylmuramyl-(pentapeptide) pyrophosphoryl-undecaprenol N-acetylglucosamine transferase